MSHGRPKAKSEQIPVEAPPEGPEQHDLPTQAPSQSAPAADIGLDFKPL